MTNNLLKEHPKLKGFLEHSVYFQEHLVGDQAVGDCPFCEKSSKFYVNSETLLWDCKKCGKRGNFDQFLKARAESYTEGFKGPIAKALSQNRGIKQQTLRAWGVGKADRFYSVPCGINGHITDIHRFTLGKHRLCTSGSRQSIMGPKKSQDSQTVWIAEGEWDGMALYEALRSEGEDGEVYAVPGAGTFPKKQADLFAGKTVHLIYDNDEAGRNGMLKARNLLQGLAREIHFMVWPEGIQDEFDFRDLYQREGSKGSIEFIKNHLKSEDQAGVAAPAPVSSEPSGKGLSRDEVIKRYRKYLHLPVASDLDVIFGTAFANRIGVDPLWLFVVASSGGMKSEALMSLDGSPAIYCTTSMTPKSLISGANFVGGGDPSLIPRLNKKTLVVKDFTGVLSMNMMDRDAIFGVLRDAYDGKISREFGNGIVRRYESRFGIIAGVTHVIEAFAGQHAVLGERFIKYRLRTPMGKASEVKVIDQAIMNLKKEVKMRAYLQEIAKAALDRKVTVEDAPDITHDMARKMRKLAQWTAFLRGVVSRDRYTGHLNFKPSREIGTRLAKQFCTLALGMSIFRQEDEISDSTFEVLRLVARDTAPDRAEEVVRQMFIHRKGEGCTSGELAEWTRFPTNTVTYLMEDMTLLKIVVLEGESRIGRQWKLSSTILRLIKDTGLYHQEQKWSTAMKDG